MDLPSASPRLILFVDDFEDARDMYGQYLDFIGYKVQMAASGEEAIGLAKLHIPALILMDIEMPGMSGGAALRLLRAEPTLADIPVIAFTAHALEHELAAHIIEGFDAVIPKPCLPDDLVTLIEPFLTHGRVGN
jgi:two-component system, cell cycle response regulator DivK